MDENTFQREDYLEKKSKIKEFYNKNKIKVYSFFTLIIFIIIFFNFYIENKKNEQIALSESYIDAKIYIEKGQDEKAIEILKKIAVSKNDTYSVLALFLLLDKNFVQDKKEILDLFDHILDNAKFDKDIKNLIVFKKAIFQSNFVLEDELLKSLKPLLNDETVWKPHALLLLGDFYLSKGEKNKAKEFYNEILSIKDLDTEFYKKASIQIAYTNNE
tara:strand:+ start:3991 stop:4638 length:648 start_codon:yes stop_codon:yes gene_type:complete